LAIVHAPPAGGADEKAAPYQSKRFLDSCIALC
jgi:hypothetical protein